MKLIEGVMMRNFRKFVGEKWFDTKHYRVLLTGPNGSGKTSIKQAIEFTAKGSIAGEPKKDGDLWVAIGRDDQVSTGITIGGKPVQRILTRKGKSTSHTGQVNGENCKKAEFDMAVSKHIGGRLNVLDLTNAFWEISTPKKMDFLLRYYRGKLDVTSIDAKFEKEFRCENPNLDVSSAITTILEKIRAEKSSLTTALKGYDLTIKATTKSDNELELPSGNLSQYDKEETQTNISLVDMYRSQGTVDPEDFEKWKQERAEKVVKIDGLKAKGLKTLEEYDAEIGTLAYEKYTGGFADFVDKLMESVSTAGCGICGPKLLIKKTHKDIKAEQERLKGADQALQKIYAEREDAERLKNAEESLKTHDADPRSKALTDSQKDAALAVKGMEARLEEIKGIKQKFEKKQTYQALIADAKKDRAKDEESLENVKEAEIDAVDLRKKILADVFTPVMESIDKSLPSGKALIELDDNDNLFIGWQIDDNRKVRRSALSGGESVMFDAAMALGLVQLGKSSTDAARVLLIEAAELDFTNFSLFCDKLLQLPNDVQVFLLNCNKTETFGKDWKVISFWGE